jgi:hypothetical protein
MSLFIFLTYAAAFFAGWLMRPFRKAYCRFREIGNTRKQAALRALLVSLHLDDGV